MSEIPDESVATSRSRPQYAGLTLCVVVAGLASRSSLAAEFPDFIASYAGDTLWALMVYLVFATVWCDQPPGRIATYAGGFAAAIEVSQLFRPEWLETIRNMPGMRLVLGYGFLWSDLACYGAGVFFGWVADCAAFGRQTSNEHSTKIRAPPHRE